MTEVSLHGPRGFGSVAKVDAEVLAPSEVVVTPTVVAAAVPRSTTPPVLPRKEPRVEQFIPRGTSLDSLFPK